MKKILVLVLTLASIGSLGSIAPAKASALSSAIGLAANAATPQLRIQIGQDRRDRRWGRYRRSQIRTQTRFIRYGRRTYRETYQIRYFPNGNYRTTLVSRVRVA